MQSNTVSTRFNSPHREVGVDAALALEPPPRGGGYGVLRFIVAMILVLIAALPALGQGAPDQVTLSPLVTIILEDDQLGEAERRQMLIFHGQWDELEDPTPAEQLELAALQHHADELPAAGGDEQLMRRLARVFQLIGQAEDAIQLYADADVELSAAELLYVAQVHEDLGAYEQAVEILTGFREQALEDFTVYETAEDLTAAAEAVIMLARLEGRPSSDFQLANQMLSRSRSQLDPLYWPTYLAEAELLWARGSPYEAADAIGEALSLNPRSSEGWYLLGTMRCRYFDFATAERAVEQLRDINPEHPLASALEVQIALRQKDMARAERVIDQALDLYPTHRELLALSAAVAAQSYDEAGLEAALTQFTELAPGNPRAAFTVGQALSDARQYALAEPHLLRAIELMPGWSDPQLALGRLYMDWGRLPEAAEQLRVARTLDTFSLEITNLQIVLNDMLGYETIQTDQFIVRYMAGVDEVLARDMALHMGVMVDTFIARFGHDPPGLTQVDLMPTDEDFAVRLTGMPDIWTIAACTGDVIAMTAPRPGAGRAYGAYNWLNVMGHEYAHVVNLSQTNNRVPHWFTEGCAVMMETTGRLWRQHMLLAQMYNTDGLFTFDEINWGFIRPTEAHHRPLAYAQSAWIIEYIEQNHGWGAVLEMLDLYAQGYGEAETIGEVFDLEPEDLMDQFMVWAGEQVQAWGMATYGVEPDDPEIREMLAVQDVGSVDLAVLTQLIEENPDEPDLLKLQAMYVMLLGERLEESIEALQAYQRARPVDPWATRELARIALVSGDAETAIDALLTLDRIEGDAPEYAYELAQTYRRAGNYDRALHFAERALLREAYNPTFRELAATIAVENQDYERAAFHVESLALLEPERAIHQHRLAVIYQRLGRDDAAAAAQEHAESLELLEDDE